MQSGGATSNTYNMERIEGAFRDAARTFDISTQLTVEWLNDARRKIVDLGSTIEDNHKNIHGLQEQVTSNVTEISGTKANIEVHEDKIARLEERIKELQKAHQTQGQQTEIIGAHQLLGDVSVQELKERIEKIEALAQPVTISDPYISQEQYKGHPENPGFTQLLPAQPSES